MLLKAIVDGVNNRLAGERLSYYDMLPFLDSVIDDINTQMNSCFPAFSELPVNTAQYDCFPDRYLRTVLMPGTAYYYYISDEEGAQGPGGLQQIYLQNLFYMLRDYLCQLPAKYTASDEQGMVSFSLYGYPAGVKPSQYVEPIEEEPDAEVEVVQILIGNTLKLPYGSDPVVVNRGTPERPILEFGLPEGPVGAQGPAGPQGLQGQAGATGATGPAGADGTFRSIKNLTLEVAGWAAVIQSQLTALNLSANDDIPTHAYIMDDLTVLSTHTAMLFGPESDPPLFRKCLTSDGQITFFTVGEPLAAILIDAVVLF